MLFKADSGNVAYTVQSSAESRTPVLIARKIWLPKALYDSLPWFYLIAGVAALMATLYINAWFWILPHYFLFSAICLHLSFIVFRRRLSRKRDTE
jgi:Flp pilus assembly protein TadB